LFVAGSCQATLKRVLRSPYTAPRHAVTGRGHGEQQVEARRCSGIAPLWDGENRGKSGVSTVNEFLSKRFKFADNSCLIRFE
jgi:hypothetical protein